MKNKYSIFSLIKNALSNHENWQRAWKDPNPKKEYDAVIIGGGGSSSHLIIEKVLKQINSACIIVIPLISLKSISKLESILKTKVQKLSISQHQSYRGVSIGEDIRLSPLNPVFILKGELR